MTRLNLRSDTATSSPPSHHCPPFANPAALLAALGAALPSTAAPSGWASLYAGLGVVPSCAAFPPAAPCRHAEGTLSCFSRCTHSHKVMA